MLEQVLQYLNNWFLIPDGIHEDDYTIEDGGIVLPFLKDGQYFRIFGSVFNDGLHQYPDSNLVNETFTGSIWALAVPNQVVTLADEIQAWKEKHGEPSPYTSESFGGYSYSKDASYSTWQGAFKDQLLPWKKIRENSPVKGQRRNVTIYPPFNPYYPFGGEL